MCHTRTDQAEPQRFANVVEFPPTVANPIKDFGHPAAAFFFKF
jgi:hypothetical protein